MNDKKECFICCTHNGKSENEIKFELIFNKYNFNFPLIPLSDAYNCDCKHSFAHNKCLFSIKKCPTCRKTVLKPNLYVKSVNDYYLKYYLNWIKKDPKRIKQVEFYLLLYFCIIFLPMLGIIEYSKKYSLFFSVILLSVLYFGIFLYNLKDYFIKYWLYSPSTNKFYVFE